MSKRQKAQKKFINELKNQLFIQAERLGIKERYSPVYLEELKIDSVRRILSEFYMEKSNLEYELNMFGSKKKEVLIKLERLNSYIRKAQGIREQHGKIYENLLDQGLGDIARTNRAVKRLNPSKVRAAA